MPIICNICGEIEDDCRCTEEEKKAHPPKPVVQPIIQLLSDGTINAKDMTLTYSGKLRGSWVKILDKIESEQSADMVLFEEFSDFYRVSTAGPGDTIYVSVSVFEGSVGFTWMVIRIDKIVSGDLGGMTDAVV